MSVVPITQAVNREPDLVDLSESVVGPELLLTHTRAGEIVLHVVHGGSVSHMGTYDNVAAAWEALDKLDAPEG